MADRNLLTKYPLLIIKKFLQGRICRYINAHNFHFIILVNCHIYCDNINLSSEFTIQPVQNMSKNFKIAQKLPTLHQTNFITV